MNNVQNAAVRIAKYISREGYCSRREAERLIYEHKVIVNGEIILSPAFFVGENDVISVENKIIKKSINNTRVWLYHKPKKVIISHSDECGREIFLDILPASMPYVVTIGRLDYMSEGLILLTNNGMLKRYLELPENKIVRKYRVQAYGSVSDAMFHELESGIMLEGIKYKSIEIILLDSNNISTKKDRWFDLQLIEGKNREIRKIFAHFNLLIKRLVRIEYAGFELDDLKPNAVLEVPEFKLKNFIPIEYLVK